MRAASWSSVQLTLRYDAGMAASCSAYHTGLLVLPTSRVVSASRRSVRPMARGRQRATASRDDDLDVELPSDGEMLLEHGDRVEIGRWVERLVKHLHPADPVDPVCPPGVRSV